MALARGKKQDDKYLTALRELVTNGGGNRQCFDCGQKGPTYVNMTIGSFVCTRCSGVLRGLTPPHRVKSISMATFTQDEIDFLKAHGNNECAKTWLGLWDPKRVVHQDHRELMIDKYERKRYYLEPASPLKSLTNAASLISNINATATSPTTTTSATTNGHKTIEATTNENFLSNGKKHDNKKQQQQQHQIHLKPPNGLRKSHSSSNNNNNNNNKNNHSNQKIYNDNAFNLNHHVNFSELQTNNESGFGSNSDFVADFGSANIFNAGMSSTLSNGYAKIQQHKLAQQQQQSNNNNNNNDNNNSYQFLNGQDTMVNNGNMKTPITTTVTNGSNENFADFDHAPIYNAAGLPISKGINNTSIFSANNNNDNQRNNKSNNNNAGKLNRTPSEDRYAALKDLDEQLRESKAVTDVFSSSTINANTSINPFKSQQQQQLQQQQQQQQQLLQQQQQQFMANPFQTHPGVNYYQAQMTVLPNNAQNMAMSAQNYYNYNNRYVGAPTGMSTTMQQGLNGTGTGPNACGFGFTAMQQEIGGTVVNVHEKAYGGGDFNNPFVVSGSMNSNNPFL